MTILVDHDAAIAGHFGVPVVLVAGDGAICRQAREILGEVETAAACWSSTMISIFSAKAP